MSHDLDAMQDMEEPVPCECCGEWVELQSTRSCQECGLCVCRDCYQQGLCVDCRREDA
jgi:hypothetical protein